MNNPAIRIRLLLAIISLLTTPSLLAAAPVKTGKSKAEPAAAQTSLREVSYPDLENRIDSHLVIHTTNNTTRSGRLVRYTNVSLIVELGPENGSIELTVPRTTIRKVMIEVGAADPLFPDEKSPHEGKPGAKKN